MRDRHVDGAALRAIRLRQQLRQVDLAQRATVTPAHLNRIEGDTEYCSDMLALRLADALGVSVDAFTRPGRHPRFSEKRAA